MKSIIKKIFITICLLIISLPLIFFIFKIKVKSKFSAEEISLKFDENFPLKEELIKITSSIKENLLQVNSVPNITIQLKDNWLFCGDHFSNNLSESLHYLNFNENEINILNKDLNEKEKWCKENNINFYLAIAPNKESVYSNLISITKLKKDSKMQQLEKICKKNSINYINLGLKFPINSKQILYHKTDTHWNEYGGYFGYLSIIESINKHEKLNISPISIENYKVVESHEIIGDLDELRGKEKKEHLVRMSPNNYTENSIDLDKRLKTPIGYENDPNSYEKRFGNSTKKLKVLVLCDSFGGYFIRFLKESFGEVVLVWSHEFNKELILNEKPDILIQEFVERNVDFLLEDKK